MSTTTQDIKNFTRQLYPDGRAFKMPADGWLTSLHNALAVTEAKSFNDAVAIKDSLLPDNANFTEQDATDWERRLGLITGTGVSLEDRKLAIKRKINHPGNIPARQHYLYLQGQLRAAGFDVYVFENRFDDGMGGYETRDAITVSGGVGANVPMHGDIQHGDAQHGARYNNIIANSIDEYTDSFFNVGNNLRSTFFIGGNPVGSYAQVPLARKAEFRQLILKLKPVQAIGYLFIAYA